MTSPLGVIVCAHDNLSMGKEIMEYLELSLHPLYGLKQRKKQRIVYTPLSLFQGFSFLKEKQELFVRM